MMHNTKSNKHNLYLADLKEANIYLIGGHSDFGNHTGKTLTVAGQRQIFTELSPLRLMRIISSKPTGKQCLNLCLPRLNLPQSRRSRA